MPSGLIRAIGVDDGYFKPHKKGKTKIVMVLLRADNRLEGILSSNISVDGIDSTEKIIGTLKASSFPEQASCIFLDGINFAGFNVADAQRINNEIGIPVIIVFRKQPNIKSIKKALARLPMAGERIALIEKAGKIHKAEKILFQCHGIPVREARALVEKFTIHSHLPEPVRIAHMVASGLTLGKSTSP